MGNSLQSKSFGATILWFTVKFAKCVILNKNTWWRQCGFVTHLTMKLYLGFSIEQLFDLISLFFLKHDQQCVDSQLCR